MRRVRKVFIWTKQLLYTRQFLRESLKMKQTRAIVVGLILLGALLALPIAHGAGGRIEGKVTDPKGAVVVGATVTATDPVTGQTFTAISDQQGRYKIEGLPAGAYSVVVGATG